MADLEARLRRLRAFNASVREQLMQETADLRVQIAQSTEAAVEQTDIAASVA
ncbi:hypothetical protein ACCS66_35500 [Rhizobium ruizarguesonis]